MSDTQSTAPAPASGFTADDVARMKAAIAATGNVAGVTYDDGKAVRYYPAAEALALLARMEADVRAATAAVTPGVVDPLRRPVRRFVGYMRPGY